MSEAHNLFEYQGCKGHLEFEMLECTKTLAHRDDPDTSREAAERMVKSGALSRQEQEVYLDIRYYCIYRGHKDFTPKELANRPHNRDYFTIQRRLSGLHNKGKIIRTGEKRDNCMVWRLT